MNMTFIQARHGAQRFFRGAPQFLDLKHLAELEERFRRHCHAAIRHYQHWKRSGPVDDDLIERHYRDLEGRLLRRRAEEAARLYGIIRKDARRNFRKYIAAAMKTNA